MKLTDLPRPLPPWGGAVYEPPEAGETEPSLFGWRPTPGVVLGITCPPGVVVAAGEPLTHLPGMLVDLICAVVYAQPMARITSDLSGDVAAIEIRTDLAGGTEDQSYQLAQALGDGLAAAIGAASANAKGLRDQARAAR